MQTLGYVTIHPDGKVTCRYVQDTPEAKSLVLSARARLSDVVALRDYRMIREVKVMRKTIG